jgi:hypothetical protein
MNIYDKFVTNLDDSTASTVTVFLPVIHNHPFEEDLISFARLVTVDLTAPCGENYGVLCISKPYYLV